MRESRHPAFSDVESISPIAVALLKMLVDLLKGLAWEITQWTMDSLVPLIYSKGDAFALCFVSQDGRLLGSCRPSHTTFPPASWAREVWQTAVLMTLDIEQKAPTATSNALKGVLVHVWLSRRIFRPDVVVILVAVDVATGCVLERHG